ncbi:butyrophilin-like protein 1-like [Platysternon megacephalum]|uniref:Butyrophilin-like protein 1-like n=1 Tax=Platysternon megacephalum TaxID=55544 RepID=A0A4D9DTE0_9SAUR|nr:butyrophilin-like protein 1-like [Platysternon megacephalum]
MAVAFMSISKIAGSLEALIVGRFLIGLFCGLNMTLIPLYIQEVSPTRVRGAFSTMNQLSQTVGIFAGQIMSLENILGTSRWWPFMLSLSAIPAILQYLTLPFCPGSPRYFIINCHEDELAAREAQSTQDVLEEIEAMKEEAANLTGREDATMLRLFIVPSYKQPILIALILNASTQLSGFNAIINYSTKIFRLAGVAHPTHTMGIGAINILFTIFSVFLVERLGRRSLLMFGQFVMALCKMLLTLSIATLGEVPWTKYFLILALFTMVAFYEIGPGPISWYITAELFSQSARPVAMGLTSSWNWFHKFIVAMFYQPLLHLVGPDVFLLFTGVLLVAVLYTYFRVPETRGRTFEEVAAEFRQVDAILTSCF